MSLRRALVRLARLFERVVAVDHDADRAVVEQAPDLCKLGAVRSHLGRRYGNAEPLGFLITVESKRVDRKQRAAALECASENELTSGRPMRRPPGRCRAAHPQEAPPYSR